MKRTIADFLPRLRTGACGIAAPVLLSLAFCAPAHAAVDARSYVQKGLVACYDGIDNAGTGTHDGTTTNWVDLTGHGNGGTLGANVSWVENGWVNAADGQPVLIPVNNGIAKTMATKNFTAEFACTPARSNVRQTFWGTYSNRGFSVEHNSGSGNKTGFLRLYGNGSQTLDKSFTDVTVVADEWASLSLSVATNRQVVWKNGATSSTNAATVSGGYDAACQVVIGGENSRTTMAFRGTYNAFRVYDRVLSEDEIKVNAAVDAIRFRGADPEDFTLAGGYSFDEDGDMCVTVSASAGANGSIAIDGGPAGTADSTTVKQFAPVTIVATAADGFVFAGWEGDLELVATDTVQGGTVATITVSAAHVASFSAAFAPKAHALDARSYVQKGLVAQYDGIENAGAGLHDANAATWIDLTGRGNDGAVGEAVSWISNGWANAASGRPIEIGNDLSATTGTGLFTAEFACTPARQSTRECFFSQYDDALAPTTGAIALEHNSGSDYTGKLRFYRAPGNQQQLKGNDILSSFVIPAGSFSSAAAVITPESQILRLNGTLAHTNVAAGSIAVSRCPSVIGGDPYRADFAFHGTYNAFRLYDRALTAEESAVNAAVDAIRFDGADPGDFEPVGGYAFDENGAMLVTVAATAEAGGTVAADGGPTGASASSTGAQHRTVALAATPDAGFAFYRWEGDTDAIVSGWARNPSIIVSAGYAARLVATFRAVTVGLASHSYVQRGLVACYDGIDNAGSGRHDAAAATWTDLTGNGNDGTLGANVTWDTNGWVNAENGKPVVIAAGGVSATTASKTFTAEFACTPSRSNTRETFFGQYDTPGISIEHYLDNRFRFYAKYANNGVTDDQFGTGLTIAGGEWASISVACTPTNQTVRKNGADSLTMSGNLTGSFNDSATSVIGGENNRTTMAFRGTYNAFRLYDRVLSDDEIKVNAAVDAVRFGGKTVAQVSPLPDGWSFDENGTLFVTLSASAGPGGRVRVNGGAPARSVSATVNQDGTTAVVVTAVPISGYAFERWTGDTAFIQAGSPETAEIVLDATGPASVAATFVKVSEPPTVVIFR